MVHLQATPRLIKPQHYHLQDHQGHQDQQQRQLLMVDNHSTWAADMVHLLLVLVLVVLVLILILMAAVVVRLCLMVSLILDKWVLLLQLLLRSLSARPLLLLLLLQRHHRLQIVKRCWAQELLVCW